MTGCSPYPINYLQFFYALLSSNSATIHIERGRKKRQTEFGMSVSAGEHEEQARFSKEMSYDIETGTVDTSPTNCFMRFPRYSANFYGALLGKNGICGLVEGSYSEIAGQSYYSAAGGIGVRLYHGMYAGRAFFLMGITNYTADVAILQDKFGTWYYMSDSFKARRGFVGLAFGWNTINEQYFINPFINMNIRSFNLFKYELMNIGVLTISGTAGVYRQLGPVRLSTGLRCNYQYRDEEKILHPELVVQCTFTPGS